MCAVSVVRGPRRSPKRLVRSVLAPSEQTGPCSRLCQRRILGRCVVLIKRVVRVRSSSAAHRTSDAFVSAMCSLGNEQCGSSIVLCCFLPQLLLSCAADVAACST
eukprot:scaffold285505_cov31-Tisochrysis_lutea.AAC.6